MQVLSLSNGKQYFLKLFLPPPARQSWGGKYWAVLAFGETEDIEGRSSAGEYLVR